MRDINKAIERVESTLIRGLDRTTAPPREKRQPLSHVREASRPPSSQFWRAPVTNTRYPEQFKSKGRPMTQPAALTARALKVTVVLNVAEIAKLPTPDGQARSKLTIDCDGRVYNADVATKSLRKAKTTITAHGAENVAVIVQGKLKGNEITECGIVAQVKVAKTGKEAAE
jgi:hypothetical protein